MQRSLYIPNDEEGIMDTSANNNNRRVFFLISFKFFFVILFQFNRQLLYKNISRICNQQYTDD